VKGVSLPIVCAWCERVRTSAGRWEAAGDEPVAEQATHGICPDCLLAQTREAGAGSLAFR
jgi:hypothetical protein